MDQRRSWGTVGQSIGLQGKVGRDKREKGTVERVEWRTVGTVQLAVVEDRTVGCGSHLPVTVEVKRSLQNSVERSCEGWNSGQKGTDHLGIDHRQVAGGSEVEVSVLQGSEVEVSVQQGMVDRWVERGSEEEGTGRQEVERRTERDAGQEEVVDRRVEKGTVEEGSDWGIVDRCTDQQGGRWQESGRRKERCSEQGCGQGCGQEWES